MRKPGTPPLITIFGGGGFIGRYVCEALLKSGARLRVAERNPRRAWYLQPLGGVGQVSAMRADLGKPELVHVDGAERLAAAAAAAGARSFVHVSAIGADPAAKSEYGRTKGLGEQAVKLAFPNATIIRPSVVFGPEDDFTNRFATLSRLPFLPVVAPRTRFQPVFVRDLGQAIAAAALDPKTFGGKTFELGGPENMTMRELNAGIAAMAGQSPELVEVPDFIASLIAMFGFLPGAPLTDDQWLMLQKDNVPSGSLPGFKAFGIVPTPLGAVAPEWLGRYRTGGRFAPRAA
jgi:uncharacterized protein YbjT (DUF2867 family)